MRFPLVLSPPFLLISSGLLSLCSFLIKMTAAPNIFALIWKFLSPAATSLPSLVLIKFAFTHLTMLLCPITLDEAAFVSMGEQHFSFWGAPGRSQGPSRPWSNCPMMSCRREISLDFTGFQILRSHVAGKNTVRGQRAHFFNFKWKNGVTVPSQATHTRTCEGRVTHYTKANVSFRQGGCSTANRGFHSPGLVCKYRSTLKIWSSLQK